MDDEWLSENVKFNFLFFRWFHRIRVSDSILSSDNLAERMSITTVTVCLCESLSGAKEIVKRCTKIWLMMMEETNQGRCTVHSFFALFICIPCVSLFIEINRIFCCLSSLHHPRKTRDEPMVNCYDFFYSIFFFLHFVISFWNREKLLHHRHCGFVCGRSRVRRHCPQL